MDDDACPFCGLPLPSGLRCLWTSGDRTLSCRDLADLAHAELRAARAALPRPAPRPPAPAAIPLPSLPVPELPRQGELL